jgi:RHS repeat-associated protein
MSLKMFKKYFNMKPSSRIQFLRSALSLSLFLMVMRGYTQTPATLPPAYSATTVNYLRTWTPTAPEQNPANLLIRPLSDVKQVTEYSDGFGRLIQSVSKGVSPAGNDMVDVVYYDPATGNQTLKYLPFTSTAVSGGDMTSDGNFKVDGFQQQAAFFNTYLSGQQNETNVGTGGSNWAYGQAIFEASPLDRILSAYAPGKNWVGSQGTSTPHSTQLQYLANTSTDNVQIWNIPAWSISNPELASSIIPANGGAYLAGVLYKTIATDEQGLQTVDFKDKFGQTILRKVQLQSSATPYTPFDNGTGSGYTGWISTYYVYDDHGNLRFVITPDLVAQMAAGSWSISQAQADELCYRFEYDQLNRIIVKKTPGTPTGTAGETWQVYDQRNRLVMQQDGNMRSIQKWLYTQYDNLDRPIAQGLITDPNFYNNLSYHVGNAATSSNNSAGVSAWPVLSSYSSELLAQVFYDNYSNIPSALPQSMDGSTNGTGNSVFTTANSGSPVYAQSASQTKMTQGLTTGTNAEVLGSNGGQYIPTINFYDDKGRLVQTQSINYSGGKDIATSQYDWSGKQLNTLMTQTYSSLTNPQTHLLVSNMNYDATGRLQNVVKTIGSTINGVTVNSPATTISAEQYDELSRLQKKTLGNNLETLTYGYNVRGWLLGINQGYISGSTSNYFGLELAYDKTVSVAPGNTWLTPAFNGNICGTAWKTKGDGINRKYDLSYDNASRLTGAAFLQNSSASSWDKSFIDFSVSGISYDANGNMNAMQQNGFAQGGSKPIDQLSYHYINGPGNSNRLSYVDDGANVTNSTLGDFHFPGPAKTTSSVDYTYDADANITSDNNRSITSISYYSYPNLPNTITTSKGTIRFFYDAAGHKLGKLVTETTATINGLQTSITTTTKYLNGFEYKTLAYGNSAFSSQNYTDQLQFVGNEEGRLRYKPIVGAIPASYVHDYMIRDQLGDVRVGLTDEQPQDIYPAATGETTSVTVGGVTSTAQNYETQYFAFNASDFIGTTTLPSWFTTMSGSNYANQNQGGIPVNNDPYSQTTTTSAKVFQLCGNPVNNPSGDRFGLGITLKVMAGDVVNIYGTSFWHNTGTLPTGNYPVSSVITNLLSAFGGSTAVTSTISHAALGGSTFDASGTGTTATLLSPMFSSSSNQSGTQAPYAGINYVIFDDQFRPQGPVVGMDAVSTTTDNIKNHSFSVSIPRNGYLFVYVSNQSNINVYFDNLQVTHTHGPLMEETHYYPVGLAMAGISDRAWNKQPNYFHYQGKEIQDEEWNDGSGLEEIDFKARHYDPQLGRFNATDPAGQYASPYTGMGNNWMNGIDPDGKNFWNTLGTIGLIVGSAVAAYLTAGTSLGVEAPYIFGGAVLVGGYLGASWESGNYNPAKWDGDAWKGAIAGELVAASLTIGGYEIFNGQAATAAFAHAFGAGDGAMITSTANQLLINLATTETKDLWMKDANLTWNEAFVSTVTSVVGGVFKGLNPVKAPMEEDKNYFTGLGLRTPVGGIDQAADESLFHAFARVSLFNLVSVSGNSVLSNVLNGAKPFSKWNLPAGPLPVTLTLGKGQALFQPVSNVGVFTNLLGIVDDILYQSASYDYNTLQVGAPANKLWDNYLLPNGATELLQYLTYYYPKHH